MSRLSEYKKATFEDKFFRHWSTRKQNHNEIWADMKKRNRKLYRLIMKRELKEELKNED